MKHRFAIVCLLLPAACCLLPAAAAADPVITPLVAGALVSVFGIGAGVATFIGGVVSSVTLAAASYAVANVFGLNRAPVGGRGPGARLPNSSEARVSVRQATPPHRFIYGRALTGGAYFFLENKPPFLYSGFLLAAHEIDAVERHYVNNKPLTVDAGGAVTAPTDPDYPGRLSFSLRKGLASQAIDPVLTAAFISLPASFRQAGTAAIVVKADYGANDDEFKKLWGNSGDPKFEFLVRGRKVYDPRDPAQVTSDAATWKWSRNAALCIIDWTRFGLRLPESRIDWTQIAAAANTCDEQVLTKAGKYEPRYTVDGLITLDEDPWSILQAMLTSCRGKLVDIGGRASLVVGGVRETAGTIHQDMLAGGFEVRREAARNELINVVRTEFVAPDRDYQLANGPVLTRTDLITSDGARYEKTIRLPFTESAPRVQRLAKAFLETSRRGRRLTVPCHLEAVRYTAGDVVQVWFDDFPRINGLYEVENTAVSADFARVDLVLSEYDVAAEAFDAAADEKTFTLDPQSLAA